MADLRLDARPVLLAPAAFKGTYSATEVAEALAEGVEGEGVPVDRCPIELDKGADLAALLAKAGFNDRMRAARCVVVGEGRIDHSTLRGKPAGEIATRARQGGVPCHAVVGENAISAFDSRIIDLMEIIVAPGRDELIAAGRTIAHLI